MDGCSGEGCSSPGGVCRRSGRGWVGLGYSSERMIDRWMNAPDGDRLSELGTQHNAAIMKEESPNANNERQQ